MTVHGLAVVSMVIMLLMVATVAVRARINHGAFPNGTVLLTALLSALGVVTPIVHYLPALVMEPMAWDIRGAVLVGAAAIEWAAWQGMVYVWRQVGPTDEQDAQPTAFPLPTLDLDNLDLSDANLSDEQRAGVVEAIANLTGREG